MRELAQRFLLRRLELGLSRAELAEKVGCSIGAVQSLEGTAI